MSSAPGSIEARLVRRLSLTLAGTVLLFAAVYLFLANDASYHAVEETGETLPRIAAAIHPTPDGKFAFNKKAVEAAIGHVAGAQYAATDNATGTPVIGSDPAIVPHLIHKLPTEQFTSKAIDVPGGLRIIHSERETVGGRVWRVALSWPMSQAQIMTIGLKHELQDELLPGVVPVLLLAIAVSWVTIRLNLRPLRRASAEAQAVSVDRPGQRMTKDGMASEITPLIDAVNRALTHLEDGIAWQKRFMANAAHELRTPLAVLRARLEGLPAGPDRDVLLRDIDRIGRAVSQLLLAARLQAHQSGETERLDLARFVRGIVADMAPLAHARQRDVALRIDHAPVVQASSTAIESAVRNLIDNALRYTPPGSAVTVRVGAPARIVVEDRGPGIPKELQERIFDPFFRGREQAGDGAGLGLAIVREVAALHGGRVGAETAPGGGARFTLELHALSGPAAAEPKRASPAPQPRPAPASISAA